MADSSDNQPSFFARLKQHHLYGVVVVYAVVAGFLIQLAGRALPAFGWGGAFPAVIIILLAGFPITVALAWTLIKPKDPAKYTKWQKLHWKLHAGLSVIVIAAAVVSGVLAWHLDQRRETRLAAEQLAAQTAAHLATPDFNPPADTLVVLPFTNLDNNPKQQYFSDGITEELTSALGQNAALRVIAWDTASRFRNTQQTANEVGRSLNVANLLHGSIERDNRMVRVIAELVDTRNGTELWSAHYDDSLANVFQVQDRITQAIAGALKVKFASLGQAPPVNPQAHDLVLQARALMDKAKTAAPFEQARKLLDKAIALDPDYADAHSGLARAWLELTQYSTLPLKQALPNVREEANKALALDPHNANALVELGNANSEGNQKVKAIAEFQRALEIDPSNVTAHLDYGTVLPLKQAQAQELEAVQLDPDNAAAQYDLVTFDLELGEYQQALAPALAQIKLAPHSADNVFLLALNYSLLRRNEEAVNAFDLAQPDTPLAKALVAAGRLTYQSVLDTKLHMPALATVNALRKRSDLDPTSTYDVIQLYLLLGEKNTALDMLPKLCASEPGFCNDLSVYPLFLPLRADPRFQQLVRKYDTVSKPPAGTTSP